MSAPMERTTWGAFVVPTRYRDGDLGSLQFEPSASREVLVTAIDTDGRTVQLFVDGALLFAAATRAFRLANEAARPLTPAADLTNRSSSGVSIASTMSDTPARKMAPTADGGTDDRPQEQEN